MAKARNPNRSPRRPAVGARSPDDLATDGAHPERRLGEDRRGLHSRRRHQRLSISRRVDFTHEGKETFGYTKDIGSRGLFIRSSHLVSEGTELELRVTLAANIPPVEAQARVMRRVPNGTDEGFAVAFLDPADERLAPLAAFVLDRLQERVNERLARAPNNGKLLCELGEIYLERGDHPTARATLQRAVAAEPNSARGRTRLAQATLEAAEVAGSEELYREAMLHIEAALAARIDLADLRDRCLTALDSFAERRQAELDRRTAAELAERKVIEAELEHAQAELETAHAESRRAAEQAKARAEADADTIRQLQMTLQADQQRLVELTAALANSHQEIAAAAEQLSASQAQIAEHRDALAEARRVGTAREKEILARQAHLEAERNELETARRTLSDDRAALARAVAELDTKRAETALRRDELDQHVRAEEERLRRTRETLEEELRERSGELDRREVNATAASASLHAGEEELARQQALLAAVQARLAIERESLQTQASELDRRKTEIEASARAATAELTARLTVAFDERDQARQQVATLEKAHADILRELDTLCAERRALATTLDQTQSSERALEPRLADALQQQEEQGRQLAEAQTEREQLRRLLDISTASEQRLTAELDAAEASTREQTAAKAEAELEQARLRRDNERLAAEMAAAQHQIDELVRERDDKQQRRASAEARQQASQEQRHELEARLERQAIQLEQLDADLRMSLAEIEAQRHQLAKQGGELDRLRRLKELTLEAKRAHLDAALERPAAPPPATVEAPDDLAPPPELEPPAPVESPTPWPTTSELATGELTAGDAGSTDTPEFNHDHEASYDDSLFSQQPTALLKLPLVRRLGTWLRASWARTGEQIVTWREHPRAALAVLALLLLGAGLLVAVLSLREPASPAAVEPLTPKEVAEVDEVLQQAVAVQPIATSSQLALSREQIVRAINTASSKPLRQCLNDARSRGSLIAGEYTLRLGFEITVDGRVGEIHVADLGGDAELVKCLSRSISTWTFPAARRRSLVRNFPFGPLRVR